VSPCQILRQNASNSISAEAPPQIARREITALPRPLAVFEGPTSKEREGKRREGEAEGRREEGGREGARGKCEA